MMMNTHGSTPDYCADPYEKGFADKLNQDDIDIEFNESALGAAASSKKGGRGGGFLLFLVAVALSVGILLIFLNMYVRPPMYREEGRKPGSVTVLLAATDSSGLNTDTLMLLNFNSMEKQISIMSIPRDTKVDCNYSPAKINSAYAANGGGENGMRKLCDYVRQCTGVYPDGYMLIDLECFVQVVDLFDGVDFDVPVSMHYDDPSQDLYIHLEPGMQHLDGETAMGLVRFRKGYGLQDLDRINVQRCFFVSALQQWMNCGNILKVKKAFNIVQEHSLTNLTASNLFWMGKTLYTCGTERIETMTIPYTIGKNYILVKEDQELLDLVNRYFNPYEEPVEFEDLNIAD